MRNKGEDVPKKKHVKSRGLEIPRTGYIPVAESNIVRALEKVQETFGRWYHDPKEIMEGGTKEEKLLYYETIGIEPD